MAPTAFTSEVTVLEQARAQFAVMRAGSLPNSDNFRDSYGFEVGCMAMAPAEVWGWLALRSLRTCSMGYTCSLSHPVRFACRSKRSIRTCMPSTHHSGTKKRKKGGSGGLASSLAFKMEVPQTSGKHLNKQMPSVHQHCHPCSR